VQNAFVCLLRFRCKPANTHMPIATFWSAPPALFDQALWPGVARVPGYPGWGVHSPQTKAPEVEITAKRKRHNIPDACAACRRSKVKCDNIKPCRRCLRDGRRVACVSWRDGKVQDVGASAHGSPVANMYTYAEVSAQHGMAGRQSSGVAAVPKRRRTSKTDVLSPLPAVQGAALPHAPVGDSPGEPEGGLAQESPGALASKDSSPRHTEELQMEEASALLLAFARACRKDVTDQF
jgi:hypothetical protein